MIGIGAFTLPMVARRFGLPAVVLEILFGLLLGPEVLNIIQASSADNEFIVLLAELGLFLLMFLAGFEVDFERLERQGSGPIHHGAVDSAPSSSPHGSATDSWRIRRSNGSS